MYTDIDEKDDNDDLTHKSEGASPLLKSDRDKSGKSNLGNHDQSQLLTSLASRHCPSGTHAV